MNRSHLTPTPITDKNGKQTTVLKKNGGVVSPAKRAAMPVPKIAAAKPQKKKLKPPLPKQLKREVHTPFKSEIFPDMEMAKELQFHDMLWFSNSQVEALDVMSVVDVDNAMLLLANNITSSDEAVAFLKEKGLERLIVDRREMMDEAVSMRVDPLKIMQLNANYPLRNYEPDTYLYAAQLAGSQSIPAVQLTDSGSVEISKTTFHEGILQDELSADDVRAIGSTYIIAHSTHSRGIYAGLKAIHSGEATYGLDTIRHVVENSRMSGTSLSVLGSDMITRYGEDYILGVDDLTGLDTIDQMFKNESTEYRRNLYEYKRETDSRGNFTEVHNAKRLMDAGVPAKVAGGMLADRMSLDQIIDAHKSGIGAPVSGGWL